MNAGIVNTALALLATLLGASVHADEPAKLAHNPFSRPPSTVSDDARDLVQSDGSVTPLDLRATMVSSNRKLANVAGRTLSPGDEVQGYVLLKILEDRAIFSRDGKRLTVLVKPDSEEDDE